MTPPPKTHTYAGLPAVQTIEVQMTMNSMVLAVSYQFCSTHKSSACDVGVEYLPLHEEHELPAAVCGPDDSLWLETSVEAAWLVVLLLQVQEKTKCAAALTHRPEGRIH